jgi:hypothetical protein
MKIRFLSLCILFLLLVSGNGTTAGFAQEVTLTTTLEAPDSEITISARYGFSQDFGKWKITDNKAIEIKLELITSTNATILIEHMHSDVFIESTSSAFDGVTQDSMDDSFHGTQGGFLLTENYPYYETFSIEGTNDQFTTTMLDMYCYNVGFGGGCDGDSQSFRISERTLTHEYGVYGNSIIFIYDVLVKYDGEDYFHKQILTDNILIDLDTGVGDNSGDRADKEATEDVPLSMLYTILALGIPVYLVRRLHIHQRRHDAKTISYREAYENA